MKDQVASLMAKMDTLQQDAQRAATLEAEAQAARAEAAAAREHLARLDKTLSHLHKELKEERNLRLTYEADALPRRHRNLLANLR